MNSYYNGRAQEVKTPTVRANSNGTFTLYTKGTEFFKVFDFTPADLQWLATAAKNAPVEDLRATAKAQAAPAPAPAPASVPVDDLMAQFIAYMASKQATPAPTKRPTKKTGGK